jgi:hypothetical protein
MATVKKAQVPKNRISHHKLSAVNKTGGDLVKIKFMNRQRIS